MPGAGEGDRNLGAPITVRGVRSTDHLEYLTTEIGIDGWTTPLGEIFGEASQLLGEPERVDPGGNGYLDFSEFLCLLFLWANVGSYTNFFEEEINCKVARPSQPVHAALAPGS